MRKAMVASDLTAMADATVKWPDQFEVAAQFNGPSMEMNLDEFRLNLDYLVNIHFKKILDILNVSIYIYTYIYIYVRITIKFHMPRVIDRWQAHRRGWILQGCVVRHLCQGLKNSPDQPIFGRYLDNPDVAGMVKCCRWLILATI
jgi:hypothetical protein